MENREILIANTKTQKRSKVTTAATTLGELKQALSAAGIDYNGMTFTEGISKTQLLDDATQLPQNVMYKGQTTNNLVILLTNTKKNIASGIGSRQEAYQIIKENNLQDAIKDTFGRNFTQVPTANLWQLIDNGVIVPTSSPQVESVVLPEDVDNEDYDEEDADEYEEEKPTPGASIACNIINTVRTLAENGIFSYDDVVLIANVVSSTAEFMKDSKFKEPEVSGSVSTSDGNINDDDIDNMLDALNM